MRNPIYIDSSWRKNLDTLKAAQKEMQTYNHLFTAYERETIKQDIAAKKNAFFSDIVNGTVNEVLDPAIQNYKGAQSRAAAARANEIKRWDAAKLRDEMQATGMILDGMLKTQNSPLFSSRGSRADQVRQLYEDAIASGDIYKQRAASEVMRGLSERAQLKEEKLAFAIIEGQARENLDSLRMTAEIQAAEEGKRDAANGLRTAVQEVINTSIDLGEGDPLGIWANNAFSPHLKRIKQTPTGDFEFLELNDPEVTGIDWNKGE